MLSDDFGADCGSLHPVAEEIEETALPEWIGRGLAELESYLAKHAAFMRYLDTLGRD